MVRKKRAPQHENHERWMVSYADFVTLLFAFFVVMFASSNADKGKAQQVSESVRSAMEEARAVAKITAALTGKPAGKDKNAAVNKEPAGEKKGGSESDPAVRESPPPSTAAAELLPSLEFLARELATEIKAGKMQVSLQHRGLVVSLPQLTFFPSGQDAVAADTYPMVQKVANVINKIPNPVRLEGHTDSVPIHNARFRSNWELSTARSIAMLELLAGRFQVSRERMAVAGYADNVPVDSNESENGRARNRRVDVVVLNKLGLMTEPVAAVAAKPREQPPKSK